MFEEIDHMPSTFSPGCLANWRQRLWVLFTLFSIANAIFPNLHLILCLYSLISFLFLYKRLNSRKSVYKHLLSDSGLDSESGLYTICNSNLETDHFSFLGEAQHLLSASSIPDTCICSSPWTVYLLSLVLQAQGE